MYAIIEKTALFIAKHGVQMEIMMKAKQKDNSQFCFLTYEDDLNAFYTHLVKMIKSGKYLPERDAKENSPDGSADVKAAVIEEPVPIETHISSQDFLDSIQSKLPAGQIANTPYAKLLSNLSRHTMKAASPDPGFQRTTAQITLSSHTTSNTLKKSASTQQIHSRDIDNEESSREESSRLSRSGKTDRGSEEVRSADDASRGPSGSRLGKSKSSAALATLMSEASHSEDGGIKEGESRQAGANDGSKGYSSTVEPSVPNIVPPSPDLQPIIDKMAHYVARNGLEFEVVVRSRKDSRFSFIEPEHIHYTYYVYKRNMFVKEIEAQKTAEASAAKTAAQAAKEQKVVQEKEGSSENDVNGSSKEDGSPEDKEARVEYGPINKAASVSFSIKAREEENTTLVKTGAFLDESSDSESNSGDESSSSSSSDDDQQKTRNGKAGLSIPSSRASDQLLTQKPRPPGPPALSGERPPVFIGPARPPASVKPPDNDKPDPRPVNRLPDVAQEKQTVSTGDIQRQLERKRRAALFASILRNSSAVAGSSSPVIAGTSADSRAQSRSSTPLLSCSSPASVYSPAPPPPTSDAAGAYTVEHSASETSLNDMRSVEASTKSSRTSEVPEVIELDDEDDDIEPDYQQDVELIPGSYEHYQDHHRSKSTHIHSRSKSSKHKRKKSKDRSEATSTKHKKRRRELSSSRHSASKHRSTDEATKQSRSEHRRHPDHSVHGEDTSSRKRRHETDVYADDSSSKRHRNYDADHETYDGSSKRHRNDGAVYPVDGGTSHKSHRHDSHKSHRHDTLVSGGDGSSKKHRHHDKDSQRVDSGPAAHKSSTRERSKERLRAVASAHPSSSSLSISAHTKSKRRRSTSHERSAKKHKNKSKHPKHRSHRSRSSSRSSYTEDETQMRPSKHRPQVPPQRKPENINRSSSPISIGDSSSDDSAELIHVKNSDDET